MIMVSAQSAKDCLANGAEAAQSGGYFRPIDGHAGIGGVGQLIEVAADMPKRPQQPRKLASLDRWSAHLARDGRAHHRLTRITAGR